MVVLTSRFIRPWGPDMLRTLRHRGVLSVESLSKVLFVVAAIVLWKVLNKVAVVSIVAVTVTFPATVPASPFIVLRSASIVVFLFLMLLDTLVTFRVPLDMGLKALTVMTILMAASSLALVTVMVNRSSATDFEFSRNVLHMVVLTSSVEHIVDLRFSETLDRTMAVGLASEAWDMLLIGPWPALAKHVASRRTVVVRTTLTSIEVTMTNWGPTILRAAILSVRCLCINLKLASPMKWLGSYRKVVTAISIVEVTVETKKLWPTVSTFEWLSGCGVMVKTLTTVASMLTVGIINGTIRLRSFRVVRFRTSVVIRAIVQDLNRLVVTLV